MRQERLVGAIGHGAAGGLAPPARADPSGLEQYVDRALRGGHPADLLDLGARHRLMIGDDRERLDRRARELARLDRLLAQQPRQVRRRAKRPLAVEDRKSTRLNSSHLGISYAVS